MQWGQSRGNARGRGVDRPDRSSLYPNGTGDREASFYLLTNTPIRGGYAGCGSPDPNDRDIARYRTVLSGDLAGNDVNVADAADMGDEPSRADNTFHVVMSYNPKVRGCLQESGPLGDLSGFTITAGHASASNDTTTPGGWADHPGGGVYFFDSGDWSKYPAACVRDCIIVANYARAGGGGADCMAANVCGL